MGVRGKAQWDEAAPITGVPRPSFLLAASPFTEWGEVKLCQGLQVTQCWLPAHGAAASFGSTSRVALTHASVLVGMRPRLQQTLVARDDFPGNWTLNLFPNLPSSHHAPPPPWALYPSSAVTPEPPPTPTTSHASVIAQRHEYPPRQIQCLLRGPPS